MLSIELLAIAVLRALVEVAGLALLGQGILYVLAGAGREGNPIYRLFRLIARPVVRLVRVLAPKAILDRHVPVVSFFLLFWLWLVLAYARSLLTAPAA